jgi:hypothetical protein
MQEILMFSRNFPSGHQTDAPEANHVIFFKNKNKKGENAKISEKCDCFLFYIE